MELLIVIKHMTGDSRQIYWNTGLPQYKIEQLKSKLFLNTDSQSKEVCEWWLRLYRGEYSEEDFKKLQSGIKELN